MKRILSLGLVTPSFKRFFSLFVLLLMSVTSYAGVFHVITTQNYSNGEIVPGSFAEAVKVANEQKGSWTIEFKTEGEIVLDKTFKFENLENLELIGNGKVWITMDISKYNYSKISNYLHTKNGIYFKSIKDLTVKDVYFQLEGDKESAILYTAFWTENTYVHSLSGCNFKRLGIYVSDTGGSEITKCKFIGFENRYDDVAIRCFPQDPKIRFDIISNCLFENCGLCFSNLFLGTFQNDTLLSCTNAIETSIITTMKECRIIGGDYGIKSTEILGIYDCFISSSKQCLSNVKVKEAISDSFICNDNYYYSPIDINQSNDYITSISECFFEAYSPNNIIDTKSFVDVYPYLRGNNYHWTYWMFKVVDNELKAPKITSINYSNGKYIISGTAEPNVEVDVYESHIYGGHTNFLEKCTSNVKDGTFTVSVDKENVEVARFCATATYSGKGTSNLGDIYDLSHVYVKENGKGSGLSWDDAMSPDFFASLLTRIENTTTFYVAEGDYDLSNYLDDRLTIERDVTICGGFSNQLKGTEKITNVSNNITRLKNYNIFLTGGSSVKFSGIEFNRVGIISNSEDIRSLYIDSCSFYKNANINLYNNVDEVAISNSRFEDITLSTSTFSAVLDLRANNISITNSSFIGIKNEDLTAAYVLNLKGKNCTIENSTFANITGIVDLISSANMKFNNNTCVGLDVRTMNAAYNYSEFCAPRISSGEMIGNIIENTSEYALPNVTTSNNIFIPRYFNNPGFIPEAPKKNIYIKEEELSKLISGSLTPTKAYDHEVYFFSPEIDRSGFLPVVRLKNDKLSDGTDIRFAKTKTKLTTDQRGVKREDLTCPGAYELLASESIDRNATDYYVTTKGTGNGSSWKNAMSFKTFAEFVPEAAKGVTFHFAAGEYSYDKDITIANDVTLMGGYSASPSATDVPSSCGTKTIFSIKSKLEFGNGLKKVDIKNISFGESAGINIPTSDNFNLLLNINNCTLYALSVGNAKEINIKNSTLLTNVSNVIDVYAQATFVESCFINSEGLIIHDHFKFRS
ncbi:MAG: hypothetical protein MJZ23_08480 [Paludibacteraceae bacterium]|nr:hypothetical protein [Paludibacteraceae bacterium]